MVTDSDASRKQVACAPAAGELFSAAADEPCYAKANGYSSSKQNPKEPG